MKKPPRTGIEGWGIYKCPKCKAVSVVPPDHAPRRCEQCRPRLIAPLRNKRGEVEGMKSMWQACKGGAMRVKPTNID